MLRLLWRCLALLAALTTQTALADNSVPYVPITVPLAVRSPYVGTYLQGRQSKNLATMEPVFWAGWSLGWSGLVRVDGEVWRWMGDKPDYVPAADNVTISTDSFSSTFVFRAGGDSAKTRSVELQARFVSPVTPSDPLRQSIPFSYLEVEISSLDGKEHAVEVYTDIDGRWASKVTDEQIEWSTFEHGDHYTAHRVALVKQRKFEENEDMPLYGDVYYSSQSPEAGVQMTAASGVGADEQYDTFIRTGSLVPSSMAKRGVVRSSSTRPVFSFVHTMSVAPQAGQSFLQAIGHVRRPLVQYMSGDASNRKEFGVGLWGGGGTVLELEPYWTQHFGGAEEMLATFLDDFEQGLAMSNSFNDKLFEDARRAQDDEYAYTVAVSTRQVFMAMEFVSSPHKKGDYMVMLKEISSNGNCQTIDVIAPMLPFLLYVEPKLLPAILEPIYRYVGTGLYTPIPPPHDIGGHYPNVTGHNDYVWPSLPLEEAGNMMNLAWAAIESSNEGKDQAKRFYSTLRTWAGYLEEHALYPGTQPTTDDFFGPIANQTSLVIKCLSAMRSFANLAKFNNDLATAQHFESLVEEWVPRFLREATSADGTHIMGQYNNDTSWFMHYNLYYDRLLDYGLFPIEVYNMQDRWYEHDLNTYGISLDSRSLGGTKTDWLAWTAAASYTDMRTKILKALSNYFRADKNEVFGDLIMTDQGWSIGYLTRPVAGGHYAVLALDALKQIRTKRSRGPLAWGHVRHAYHRSKEAAQGSPFASLSILVTTLLLVMACRRCVFAMIGRNKYSRVALVQSPTLPSARSDIMRRVSSGGLLTTRASFSHCSRRDE